MLLEAVDGHPEAGAMGGGSGGGSPRGAAQ